MESLSLFLAAGMKLSTSFNISPPFELGGGRHRMNSPFQLRKAWLEIWNGGGGLDMTVLSTVEQSCHNSTGESLLYQTERHAVSASCKPCPCDMLMS
jgi:hypothetical protein